MEVEFNKEQLQEAMGKIARGELPRWMDSYEKQAYALGVITKEHIIKHVRCGGQGEYNSYDGPDCMAMCMGCHGSGLVISDVGKALIKTHFPGYELTDLQGD